MTTQERDWYESRIAELTKELSELQADMMYMLSNQSAMLHNEALDLDIQIRTFQGKFSQFKRRQNEDSM